MDPKRLTEWLSTAQGLGTAVATLVGVPVAIGVTVTKAFEPAVKTFELPWLPSAAVVVITAAFVMLLWRSFKQFEKASRLECPDAFTLRPTEPTSLIGRTEDLAGLLLIVTRNRLVLLDGESGCGKSALVSAGLVPRLNLSDGLLPLVIRDWGDDWVHGPLSATLEALHYSVSSEKAILLGWTSSPYLGDDPVILATELDTRLDAIFSVLKRRLLLIADQFDDHQARHRNRFLDDEGNWLTPSALAQANPFWKLVRAGLIKKSLHLLVVTRADTAAGLACVRFLGEEQTTTRTLPRVEAEYLRPLLAGIAPDDAQPLVVSNPTGGWHELREQLERDLKSEGAVLMQQVRTVLLGLRQLPLLTPSRYRAAGGLRGVETLVISRALRQASNSAGGGETGLRNARAILGKLILPGGPSQPPKAQRASFSELSNIAGNASLARAALTVLQDEEVIRPAEGKGSEQAWQLDHDYLAHAVLAEARQADRWAVALREGKTRYDEAAGNWQRRWVTLLPVSTLARIYWECARRRLRFGEAASYIGVSTIRLAIFVLVITLTGTIATTLNQDRLLTAKASQLIDQLGSSSEADAILTLWHAKKPLRQRVYDLVRADSGRLERAAKSQWPVAHAGFETARIKEAATVVRARLEQERNEYRADPLVATYTVVVARMNDMADVKAEAMALRIRLEQEREGGIANRLARAYAAVAARMNDAADLKAEAKALRIRLEQERNGGTVISSIVEAYTAVAARMNNAADLKAEATALGAQLEQERDNDIATSLAEAYGAMAAHMNDAADLKAATTALRSRLEQEQDNDASIGLAQAYAAVAARKDDAADLKAASKTLRARLEHERDNSNAERLAQAYSVVAARMNDVADLKAEAKALRVRLEQEREYYIARHLAQAYAAVTAQMNDATDLKAEATALRARLEERDNDFDIRSLAQAYAAVAARISDAADLKAEATALRAQLEERDNDSNIISLAQAYAAVAARINDAAELKAVATVLRVRMELERNGDVIRSIAQAYEAVARQMNNAVDLKTEATALHVWLEQERDSDVARSLGPAYAAVASQSNDAADLKTAAMALRKRLEDEQQYTLIGSLAKTYTIVAKRMNDAADLKVEATALRIRLGQEPRWDVGRYWAETYAAVAGRMNNAADLKSEATALRARLEQERDGDVARNLAQAYAAVAGRMNDAADLNIEATALRAWLEQERNSDVVKSFAQAYAAVAARMNSTTDLKAAAMALRLWLEQERDISTATSMAQAYAEVAMAISKRSDVQTSSALTLEILIIAGHPFVNDYTPLIVALDQISEKKFGNDLGAAVSWAVKKYSVTLEQLRPLSDYYQSKR